MKRSASSLIPLAIALLLPAAVLASGAPSATQRASSATTSSVNKQAGATTTPAKPAARHWFGTRASGEKSHAPRIDLNTAAKEELTKLPGVDDALAGQIIAGRPYKAKADLLTRKIVTKEEFSRISARVATKPAPAGK